MRSDQAKKIPIADVLKGIGCTPSHTARGGDEVWYHSPFRTENTASFKLLVSGNVFYDHGAGFGGNVIDLVLKYLGTSSVSAALAFLEPYAKGNPTSSAAPSPTARVEQVSDIKIESVKVLHHPALLNYIHQERGITPALARKYAKQANFTFKGKPYFALAFENDKGGYELRNKYFKGSSSPKHYTFIQGKHDGTKKISVFEGWIDALSYMQLRDVMQPMGDILVLNSLSFQQVAIQFILKNGYRQAYTFLDNNPAGDAATRALGEMPISVKAMNSLYQGFEDVNDYLVAKINESKQGSLF